MKILVSAGEASGDRYAAGLVAELRRKLPRAGFFGCAGPMLRAAGVRAVVGVFEVVRRYSSVPQLSFSAPFLKNHSQ